VGWSVAVIVALGAFATSASAAVFPYTGAEQTYTVPPGVTLVHIAAVGGEGAASMNTFGVAGGFGATASEDLPVTPGQVLYVEVGGNGSTGGFNGGGTGEPPTGVVTVAAYPTYAS
jgi:hypothetical protein